MRSGGQFLALTTVSCAVKTSVRSMAYIPELVGKTDIGVDRGMVVMVVMIDALGEMARIDRDLHHVEVAAVGIEDEQAHARSLGVHEDEGLRFALMAGL